MTRLFGAALAIVLLLSISFGQDDTEKFRYKASKAIPVGTVLHYVKTNIDGSRPEQVAQFVGGELQKEVGDAARSVQASNGCVDVSKRHPAGNV